MSICFFKYSNLGFTSTSLHLILIFGKKQKGAELRGQIYINNMHHLKKTAMELEKTAKRSYLGGSKQAGQDHSSNKI